jgi:hypothetical protein
MLPVPRLASLADPWFYLKMLESIDHRGLLVLASIPVLPLSLLALIASYVRKAVTYR